MPSSRVERARELRRTVEGLAQNLTEIDALSNEELFPKWDEGAQYTTGQKFIYNGILYIVLANHRAQPSWAPDIKPSLYAQILTPNPDIVFPQEPQDSL